MKTLNANPRTDFCPRLVLLISCLCLGYSLSNAQQGWVQQASGTANTIQAVSFTDVNTGTAVGGGSTILRTTNGGTTWAVQFTGSTTLYGVSFVDANTGVAVGYSGTILRTTNGGVTWASQTSGYYDLKAVSLVNATTGTTVGYYGTIFRTTNGGANWTSQSGGTTSTLNGVFFTDANTGTAVGDGGTILRTTNGGATWTSQYSATTNTLYGVYFSDVNTGTVVAGSGEIFRTTNGGATWARQSSGTSNTLYGVSFADANNGVAVGSSGTILRTSNGGAAWTSLSSGTTSTLYAVSLAGIYTGTIVGTSGIILRATTAADAGAAVTTNSATNVATTSATLNGTVNPNGLATTVYFEWGTSSTLPTYSITSTTSQSIGSGTSAVPVTANLTGLTANTTYYYRMVAQNSAGTQRGSIVDFTPSAAQQGWVRQVSGTTNTIQAVSFTDANTGTAVGSGSTILRTTNGGTTWAVQFSGSTTLYGVSFADANNGVAVGSSGAILRTTNGGVTWASQTSGYNYLKAVSLVNATTGTTVGDYGTIRRTTDGGVSWTSQTVGTTSTLNGVFFTDANTGTVVGDGGTILRTTNGGATWTSQYSATTNALYAVYFSDANTGSVVAGSGEIFRTTDGGATWARQLSGTSSTLNGVSFADANNGVAVGNSGIILRTSNGGANWTSQSSVTTSTLYAVSLAGIYTGTIVGGSGIILRATIAADAGAAVTTNSATNVAATSATLNGTINPNGLATTAYFEWGTNSTLAYSVTSTTSQSIGSGTSAVPVTANLTGLTANTTYYYRMVAQNSAGTQRGSIVDFTPSAAQQGWVRQASGTANTIYGISFTDVNTGTTVGSSSTILRTTNGGTTWALQFSGSTSLYGVSFADANNGVAVGSSGAILRTTNGGVTWASQTSGYYDLNAVSLVNATTGTTVGYYGTILRTTNGGVTWTSQSGGTSSTLRGVCFTDANTGVAVGDGGTILRTTNGGATWTSQYSATTNTLYAVDFSDGNTGTVVAGSGEIFRTTNGGTPWTRQSSGTSSTLYGVSFADANNGIVVGSSGIILRTSNGGANWTSQSSVTTSTLYGVSLAGSGAATVLGSNGMIFVTTGGSAPAASSSAATGITTTSATLNGTVNPNGLATTAYFEWGTSSTLATSSSTTSQSIGVGTSAIAVTANLTGLNANTMYYYRAVAQNSAGTQKASILSFTTIALPVPSTPSLSSPSNGATAQATTLILSWATSAGATKYHVQVSTSSTYTTLVVSDSSIVGTSTSVGPLANGTTYYWRVRAGNPSGWSSYSGSWSFMTIVAAPSAPVLASPTSGATGVSSSPTLTWNSSGGATSYSLQVSTVSTFSTLLVDQSGITGTSYGLTGLRAVTVYYWRVNSTNAGGTSGWSAWWSFTTTTSGTVLGEYSPDANTVLLLHMNEASGVSVSDASSYGNNGAASGTTVTTGRFSKARSFNGWSDYMTVPAASSLTMASFTVEAWINLSSPVSLLRIVVHKGPVGSYELAISDSSTALALVSNGAMSMPLPGRTKVTSNIWHHVAATFDLTQGMLRVYLDGMEEDRVKPGIMPAAQDGPVGIGANSAGTGGYFNGVIDEVRISNIARSPSEFNLQLPPKNLSATASSTSINLSWQNGGGAVGLLRYKIYRGTDSTSISLIDSTSSLLFSNTGLTPGTRYFYRVSAVDSTGFESARSYAVSVVSPRATASGLVAYYPFNGNAKDSSGNGYDGTINGVTLTADRFGNAGKAYNFNGSTNEIVVPHTNGLNFGTGDFSVCLWAYIKDFNVYNGLIIKDSYNNGTTYNGWYISSWPPPGGNSFGFSTRNTWTSVATDARLPLSEFQTNTWCQIVGVRKSNVLYLYVNGVLRVTKTESVPTDVSTTTDLKIGSVSPALSQYLKGALDDIRIYNRPLSATEIDSLYREGSWATNITSFTPSRNALNVDKSSNLTLTFNSDINSATLTNSTVRINGSLSGLHPGMFSYNSGTRTVTISPTSPFSVGERVTVTATRSISNNAGDSLQKSCTWCFTIKGNRASGTFTQSSTPAVGISPKSIVAGDFDRDGDIDIATGNLNSGTVSILLNNGRGSFTQSSTPSVGNFPYSITAADFDRDGDIDLAVANYNSKTISILMNNGSGAFSQSSTPAAPGAPQSITSGDFNGDGAIDLAVADYGSNTASIFFNNGNGVFTLNASVVVGSSPKAITSGDFNGDGYLDLAVARPGVDSTTILLNNGDGTFTKSSSLGVGFYPTSLAVGDFDGDGDLDIAVGNEGATTCSILINNGVGVFTQSSTPTLSGSPYSIAPADLDGDGDIDLAVAMDLPPSTLAILQNNGGGAFGQSSTTSVGSGPGYVVAGDWDGDGVLDLAVANQNSHTVSVLLNAAIVAPSLLGEYTPDANTVLLLHMNETSGSTVSDASNYGNHGTATGTTIVDGRFGKVRNFNGTGNYVTVLVGPILSFGTGSFCVEGWVKISSPITNCVMIGKLQINGYALHLDGGGRLTASVSDVAGHQVSVSSIRDIRDEKWHHIVMNKDSSSVRLYSDGLLEQSASATSLTGNVSNSEPFYVGSAPNSPPFVGIIDEIRVSDKARLPQEFNLQLPAKNLTATASGTAINLTWQNGGGAVGLLRYKIYRGADSTNVSLIDSTASLFFSSTGLTPATRYFYRVSAVDSTGFEGARSYAAIAQTGTGGGAPIVATSTAVSIGSTTGTLNGSVNANGLQTSAWFEWGTINTLSTYSSTAIQSVGLGTSTVSVNTNLTSLSPSTTYYFRIAAQNSGGTQRGSIQSFTSLVQSPDVVSLSSPADGATGQPVSLALSWSPAARAATYRLQLSTGSTFASVIVDDSTLTSASRQVGPLFSNTFYFWRVSAKNAGGVSAWSSTRSFSTIVSFLAAPTLTFPLDNEENVSDSPTLNWNSVTDATSYRVQVSTTSDFATTVLDQSGVIIKSKTVTGLANGTKYYWRVSASNAAGTGPYSATRSFTTFVSAPAAPALSSPGSGSSNQPTTVTLAWNASAGATKYRLQVSQSATFASTIVDDSTLAATSKQIGPLSFGTTHYWRVSASNTGGSSSYSTTSSFTTIPAPATSLPISTTVTFPARSRAGDFVASDYRIVGLPGSTSIPIASVISGTQKKDWQVYWDNGSSSNYLVEYDGTSRFEFGSGRAFWIVSKNALTINRSVTSPTLNTSGNFEIALQPGWNLISNPFASSIPWSRIKSANNTTASIFTHNGSFASSVNFDPYAGYYYFNGSPGTVLSVLKIPYYSLFGNIEGPIGQSFEGWKVTMTLSSQVPQEETPSEASFGISLGARKEMDEFDVRKPRGIGLSTELFFDRSDWDAEYPTFVSDIRAQVNEVETWNFKVNTEPSMPARLVFGGISEVPSSLAIYLVDEANGASANLRLDSVYSFVSPLRELRFSVFVGSKDAVLKHAAQTLPADYDLSHNFPNPFNPTTSLRLSLPVQSTVNLVIFNILGQKTRTLCTGVLPTGIHWFTWDGKDDRTAVAPGGVYYCRLEIAGRQAIVRKMVFVK